VSIADFAVTRRVTVAMLATAIVVLGLFAIPRLPIALLPTFQPPVVSVTVNYGNVSPETMESTVTRPLENAVSRVSGIDYLQSNSYTGQSTIRATFKFGTDINVAATDIQQQVARAATSLPNDPLLQQPQIQKADPNSIPVVRLSVTDQSIPLRDLFDLFNNQLADEFAGVAGVGSVSVFGGEQRAIMVEPDANVLAGYGLDTNAVVNKIKAENVDAPAGVLAIGPKEFVIRANALYQNADQIANTVLTVKNGAPIYIRDVAKVSDSVQEVRSYSRLDGVPSVSLSVTAQPDANVIAVSQGVYAKIADFQKRYPTMHFGVVFDQQGFIRDAVDALMHTAIYGAILAVLIILLFLHSLRSTLIVAISLPISVLGTMFAAYMLKQTLNIMTLGGLALAVGLIVDDAVVVIENIYRHLAQGETPREAARAATSQIFSAVLASTVTVVTVFVPLLLIPGLQGLIFGPFALVIIVGVAISLLVATTTVPMLSSIMLDAQTVHAAEGTGGGPRNPYQRFSAGFDRLYGRLEGGYRRTLAAAVDRPGLVLGIGVVLLGLSLVAVKAGVVKTETFPASSSRFVQVNVRTPNGTAVANTNDVSKKVEDALRSDPRVADVSSTVGSAFGGGSTRIVTNQASLAVALKPGISGSSADAFVAQWTQRLGGTARRGTAGANANANANAAKITPEQRAKFAALRKALIGTTAFVSAIDIVQRVVSQGSDAIEIQLYGPDINQLYTMAQKDLIPQIATIPGVGRPDTNITPSQPEVDVNVDRRVAAQLGLSTGDIATLISTATSGTIASYWQTNGTQYPIMVQLPPSQRRSLDALSTMLINPGTSAGSASTGASSAGATGTTSTTTATTSGPSSQSLNAVPLSGVAKISLGAGPSQIPRQNKARYVSITAPLAGNAVLGDVLGKVTDVMNAYTFPSGYRWQYGPAITQNNDTFSALTLVVILAIALIYMLLASQFESFLDPLVIMMAVPFALIGIIASLWITHRSFGLTAFIGSLMLVGIAVKNAILVVEFTKQLRRDEGLDPREALMHAGPMRLRPILMTTLATLGGMLPIALGIEAGSQTQAPLGTVVIGGLVTSTMLSLLVVPTFYLWVARHVEPRFAPKPPSFRRRPPRTDGRATIEQPQPTPAG
jgi:hydrophobic/amphiphilic exporter-1 (mainly G- bacteria), HAE1 family